MIRLLTIAIVALFATMPASLAAQEIPSFQQLADSLGVDLLFVSLDLQEDYPANVGLQQLIGCFFTRLTGRCFQIKQQVNKVNTGGQAGYGEYGTQGATYVEASCYGETDQNHKCKQNEPSGKRIGKHKLRFKFGH